MIVCLQNRLTGIGLLLSGTGGLIENQQQAYPNTRHPGSRGVDAKLALTIALLVDYYARYQGTVNDANPCECRK